MDGRENRACEPGRDRILRSARALFTVHGYASVSMQQIANAAEVNKATLYHHFRDKEDLFVAVVRGEQARLGADIANELAAGGSLRDELQRIASRIFASTRSDFGRLMADFKEHVTERRRAALILQDPPPWIVLLPAFERATADCEIRPVSPLFAAELFFIMIFGHVRWFRTGDDRPAPDEDLAETIVGVLLDGIGTCPDTQMRTNPLEEDHS